MIPSLSNEDNAKNSLLQKCVSSYCQLEYLVDHTHRNQKDKMIVQANLKGSLNEISLLNPLHTLMIQILFVFCRNGHPELKSVPEKS